MRAVSLVIVALCAAPAPAVTRTGGSFRSSADFESPSPAFAPAARPGPAAPTAGRRLFIDTAEDGAICVRGATYKAQFVDGAATYIPFLGSRAPRNYPLEMQLESVASGGRDLE